MDGSKLPFRCFVAGSAEGTALVSADAFSLTGELDPKTGRIVNQKSRLYGNSISGKIFVFPYGRGSSCTSAILAESVRLETAPAAIVNITVEPILVVGALVAGFLYERTVPIISVSQEVFGTLRTGDRLLIDSSAGIFLRDNP